MLSHSDSGLELWLDFELYYCCAFNDDTVR